VSSLRGLYSSDDQLITAIVASKISKVLNCIPIEKFESDIQKIVQCYLDNQDRWQQVQNGSNKGSRLG